MPKPVEESAAPPQPRQWTLFWILLTVYVSMPLLLGVVVYEVIKHK